MEAYRAGVKEGGGLEVKEGTSGGLEVKEVGGILI